MVLGALIGLGLSPSFFEQVARSLGLPGVRVQATSVRRSGIQGWQVTITSDDPRPPARHLGAIERALAASDLPDPVQDGARRVFRCLAEAEAAVHGATLESVHFHEVGAVDSLVDIVGAVAGLHALGVSRVVASSLPFGSGEITFSHGTHALPAPAVAALGTGLLVHGFPLAQGETVTPTGAALVRGLAESQGPLPPLRLLGHGRGAGGRDDPGYANLLRIFLGEPLPASAPGLLPEPSGSVQIGAALDDLTPQQLAYAMEQLFRAGAVDVHVTPLLMKKGRPGHLLEALCAEALQQPVVEALLRHTSSLGCRITPVRKVALRRREVRVATPFGEIPVKEALLGDEVLHRRAEYEVAAAAARQHGVPLEQVLQAALAAAGDPPGR